MVVEGAYHPDLRLSTPLACTKHIDIGYHFIRFVVNNGTINLIYCPTDDMVADTLTKVLPNIKAKHFAFTLGLQLTWRGSVGIFKIDYTDRKVRVSFYGIQVCSYILPTRHWTWHNITIVLFMSIFVTITLHALTYYAYLFTITIVTYLVLSFILSIDQRLSGTNNYLLIYFIYILRNKLSYYSISSTDFPWKF